MATEKPDNHNLLWGNTPLYFTTSEFLINLDGATPYECEDCLVYDAFDVYSPSLSPRFRQDEEGNSHLSLEGICFCRIRYIYQYPDGKIDYHGDSAEFTGFYRFGKDKPTTRVVGVLWDRPDPFNLKDWLKVNISEGVELQYNAETGGFEKMRVQIPGRNPRRERHPVFGPQIEIDVNSLTSEYMPTGVFIPMDKNGKPLRQNSGHNGIIYTFTQENGVGLVKVGVGKENQEITFPLSLKFDNNSPLKQLLGLTTSHWADPEFLKRVEHFSATQSLVR